MNRQLLLHLMAVLAMALTHACTSAGDPPRILVFSRTTGYRHESIEAGKDALVQLCRKNGMLADTTENPAYFNESNLKRYAAVVFLNTNGEVLDPRQEADFERYIQAGGGFVGIHSASATEYTWRWYGGLVGAYFLDHPAIQETPLHPETCRHAAIDHLAGKPWLWQDEWYNFRTHEPDLHPLLYIDENTYQGGKSPKLSSPNTRHPLAWYHAYDGGRSFYTALGHRVEAYADPIFLQHLLGGIRYAVGKNKPLRYTRCRTPRAPDPSRFVKTVVADNLAEPMELALLPDGKILFIERHGRIKQYDPATGLTRIVAKLPVYSEMGDGLIGLAVDPQWLENHWIYLCYSAPDASLNRLSRFVFRGDSLDRASEQVILEIPVGRVDCFHAAGSIAFGPDDLLYLATGDNTSPFASAGFAPIDERPNRQSFDAQRSSANTHDLRGKILRIQVLPDGSYLCPAGNLFTDKAVHVKPGTTFPPGADRPEIYVMGCRNPFRIAIDQRRNFLYWGDIGPDAGKADTARGPLGHDEINQARKAGFYGWPYFVADNQAYRAVDFSTGKAGPAFKPERPINDSPNNTGARTLPAAQPAFIWYPYGKNRDFPIAGVGGRNAMAGPTYYCDDYPADTRLPDYYNGKTLIYDWMRNWIMAVSVDSLGDFHRLEPLADSVPLSRPMDMLVDNNGALWLLEYGEKWYAANTDARLSRIDYVRGNRPPVAAIRADKPAGAAPCTVVFSSAPALDADGDALVMRWNFGDGSPTVQTRRSKKKPLILYNGRAPKTADPEQIAHTYELPGRYTATLEIIDEHGARHSARQTITVGNEPPSVVWDLRGRSKSFYRPGDSLSYRVHVSDREDGDLHKGGIPAASVGISETRLDNVLNPLELLGNNQSVAPPERFQRGRLLVEGADCRSCHALDRAVNGPSFQAVAERYRKDAFGIATISRKIIYGGSGAWGMGVMIPHPNIREEDASEMARWILSLSDPPLPEQRIPPDGRLPLPNQGTYVLQARYRDRGANGYPALEAGETLVLRPALLQAEKTDQRSNCVGNYSPYPDTTVLNELKHGAWFAFQHCDLSGLRALRLRCGYGDRNYPYAGGRLEIRIDRPDGPLLGSWTFTSQNAEKMAFFDVEMPLDVRAAQGYHDLYVVFHNLQNQGQGVVAIDWLEFLF